MLSSPPPPLSHLPRSLNAGSFSTLYQNICMHAHVCVHTDTHRHTHTHTLIQGGFLPRSPYSSHYFLYSLCFFFFSPLAALRCLGDFSSQTGDPSCVPGSGSSRSNHWTTRKFPSSILFVHPFAKCHVVGLNLEDNLSGPSPYSALDAGSLSSPASLEANRWSQDQKKGMMKVC